MSLLRNEAQVALNDLLVECRKTSAHYRDSANFLAGAADELAATAGEVLVQLADDRELASKQLEQAIYRHGDLPSGGDEDRETMENLYHRVHATLAEDERSDVLEQHLQSEQAFSQHLADLIASEQLNQESELLHELLKQTRVAVARLNELSAHSGQRSP